MPITRIVNSTIDGVEPRLTEVIDDLVRYSGSDLVCYRATDPERLAKAQDEAWRTVLEWAQETYGARFFLAHGVMHVDQPPTRWRQFAGPSNRSSHPLRLRPCT